MPPPANGFTATDLQEALRALTSTLAKCEKVLPRLRSGSAQHTLLVRRIRALEIAVALVTRELTAPPAAGTRDPG